MATPDYTVKGTPTMASRDWVDERLGEGFWHKTAVAEFPAWPTRLLPGEFYPLRPQMYVWQRALAKLPDFADVEALVREAAALTAERDLNSIYKAFLWVASPQMFLRAVPRLWASYVRFGELETVENVAGLYRARISGIPEDLLDWAAGSVAGFLRPALVLAGGTSPDSQVTNRQPSAAGEWQLDYQLKYE